MIFLKLGIGIIFFLLGWIYLYKANLVLHVNRIARVILFDDRVVLLARKKLAVVFFCLSFVALYMGVTSLGDDDWLSTSPSYLMYSATQDYCAGRYANALEKYQRVLAMNNDDIVALKRMAHTYRAMGEEKKAQALWKKIARMHPGDRDAARGLNAPQTPR